MEHLVGVVVIVLIFCSYKPCGFVDQWRDWRHGLAVDQTEEWQSLENLFKEQV